MEQGSSSALKLAARAGYLAKGVVYAAIGTIALDAAFSGRGGNVEGGKGALRALLDEPFGQFVAVLMAMGLFGYAIWKLYAAATDAECEGSDLKGAAIRVGMGIVGVIYGGLGVYVLRLMFGGGGSSPSQSLGLGPTLTLVTGIAIVGFGIVEVYRAVADEYEKHWRVSEMSATERTWGRRSAKVGLTARGVVFVVMGILFIVTGSSDVGIGDALTTLSRQAFGSILLFLVAAGLLAYGMYCGIDARYREVRA